VAQQKEQRCALQDDIKQKATQHLGELTDERAAVEARLADLHQCESAFETGQTTAMERVGQQLPAFSRARQNMATMAVLLDALPVTSTDGVDEMYQRLKNILGIAIAQQAESSLQHWLMPLF
jgi:hypothetical protein